MLAEIRKNALRVSDESIGGQDVTEEFTDLGAQLTNLHATENELRQMLTTVRERSQKAADVLDVFKELSKVRGDIDRIQGKVDYLKHMTAMATIKLDLVPDRLSEPLVEPGWGPVTIARTAARSLVAGLQWVGTLLIWCIIFGVPMIVVVMIIGIVTARVVKPLWSWLKKTNL